MAVLPLAALATFETVPGVPRGGGPRPGGARVGRAALRPRRGAGPGRATRRRPCPPTAGVPEVAFDRAAPALRPRAAPRPRRRDLRLPAGGRLAVTGSSGAGKSSLVNALLRYWPLEEGTLSLGGTDVERLAPGRRPGRVRAGRPAGPAVRRHRAVEPHPRAGPTRPRTRSPPRCEAARLDDWVATLPLGLDTPVGRGRRRALRGRAPAPRGGPRPARPGSRPRPRRAHQRARPRPGRRGLDGVLAAAAASGAACSDHPPGRPRRRAARRGDARGRARGAGSVLSDPSVGSQVRRRVLRP